MYRPIVTYLMINSSFKFQFCWSRRRCHHLLPRPNGSVRIKNCLRLKKVGHQMVLGFPFQHFIFVLIETRGRVNKLIFRKKLHLVRNFYIYNFRTRKLFLHTRAHYLSIQYIYIIYKPWFPFFVLFFTRECRQPTGKTLLPFRRIKLR